jgi:hypothetical protein
LRAAGTRRWLADNIAVGAGPRSRAADADAGRPPAPKPWWKSWTAAADRGRGSAPWPEAPSWRGAAKAMMFRMQHNGVSWARWVLKRRAHTLYITINQEHKKTMNMNKCVVLTELR